jgi:hypothetical protein
MTKTKPHQQGKKAVEHAGALWGENRSVPPDRGTIERR